VGYALDAGASIIVPQVNTVAEAKHIVSAAKFGANRCGTRSAPPYRLIPGVTDAPMDKSQSIHENMNLLIFPALWSTSLAIVSVLGLVTRIR
jgi:4-hydroxy-2-oxoheptanedioate aldolase